MKILAPIFLIFLFVGGCTLTGAPSPETPREKYAAAEASYGAVINTIDQLVTAGTIKMGTPAAQTLASSIISTRTALDVWGASPDSPSRKQAALSALKSLQQLLVELQRMGA